MKLDIYFSNNVELLEEDASLSSGYVVVTDDRDLNNSITLFKKKECIVFIALIELLECLLKLDVAKKAKWVVTDSGETVELILKGDEMTLKYIDEYRIYEIKQFIAAVKNAILGLLERMKGVNNNILTESPYIDLKNRILSF